MPPKRGGGVNRAIAPKGKAKAKAKAKAIAKVLAKVFFFTCCADV